MNGTKKNRGPVIALVALVVVVAICAIGWFALRPDTNTGAKTLTIEVVHGDGSSKEYEIHTDAEYLGDALVENEKMAVVGEEGAYGLYIKSVDGEEASDAEHTYWAVRQDGVDLMVGVDSQPIADGERYELVLATW